MEKSEHKGPETLAKLFSCIRAGFDIPERICGLPQASVLLAILALPVPRGFRSSDFEFFFKREIVSGVVAVL